jgi:hypothetical protein
MEEKKTQKLTNEQKESHVQKMPNHANFDRIQLVSNVQCDPRLDASIKFITMGRSLIKTKKVPCVK